MTLTAVISDPTDSLHATINTQSESITATLDPEVIAKAKLNLYELAQEVYKQFSILDMGADIEDYTGWFTAAAFNAFESNLETINKNIFTQDYGVSQRFFDNGQFIKWDELNRIESATLQMNDLLERQKATLRKLPFRLGAFREVRI